jgi:hypothetical protein
MRNGHRGTLVVLEREERALSVTGRIFTRYDRDSEVVQSRVVMLIVACRRDGEKQLESRESVGLFLVNTLVFP